MFKTGLLSLLFIVVISFRLHAQRLGGYSVFNFMDLPKAAQLSALGGTNVSAPGNDLSLVNHNPALLKGEMDRMLSLNFNTMYAGIKCYQLDVATHSERLLTTFSAGISYVDYGSLPQTDALGNETGIFRPGDFVIQVGASRKYSERIRYGFNLKYIGSNYGIYKASGLAFDAGILYADSTRKLQASILIKNAGVQLRSYAGTPGTALPLDLQAGITKRLADAPVQFSLTAHHLHQFDIKYRDSIFNTDNDLPSARKTGVDNLFRHFVLACQVYVGQSIELTGAYNHLRRAELTIPGTTNGLNGFSLGVGVLFSKMQFRYARSYYQSSSAYNHLGININFREFTFTRP